MKLSARCLLSAVMAGLLFLPAAAEEPSAPGGVSGLLKRAANVDDPIPETYEPLNSTYVGEGERLNSTIEQSWQLKKEAGERGPVAPTGATGSPERETLEQRIQEPGVRPASSSEPVVTDTGKTLEIRGE